MHWWLVAVYVPYRQLGLKEVRFESDEGVLELVNTDLSDVEIVADRFVPIVKLESKGVSVRRIGFNHVKGYGCDRGANCRGNYRGPSQLSGTC